MKKRELMILVVGVLLAVANVASADTFDAGGANEFTIDFVNISGATNPAGGYGVVNNDYRMGTYEITNDQWNKFVNIYGTPTGNSPWAYDASAYYTGTEVPTNMVSWLEGVQFANWLNTSTDHQAAYKFTGTQGQGDYAFVPWESGDTGYDADNPYRNSNAYYFLPTDDEWVKAAYWNGTTLQTYATIGDIVPIAGVDTNYDNVIGQPWDIGSGSEELNGTFDMMGNVSEWMESLRFSQGGEEPVPNTLSVRGGSYASSLFLLTYHDEGFLYDEAIHLGFRVASVPEPVTFLLLGLGAVMLRRKGN